MEARGLLVQFLERIEDVYDDLLWYSEDLEWEDPLFIFNHHRTFSLVEIICPFGVACRSGYL